MSHPPSLHPPLQMLAAKDELLQNVRFNVVKLQKTFNDSLEALCSKMKELGIPEEELKNLGFSLEQLPEGSTNAPALGLIAQLS